MRFVSFSSRKKVFYAQLAAASCQRKLKLDNSSCRFSFATSVQKTVKLQKKIIYVFYRLLSSLIKKFFNYFFLFPSFLSTDYSHPLNSPNDRNNFSFFFIFHVCNNARDQDISGFFYHHHESIQLDIKSCGNDMINPQLLNNNPKTRHKIITAQQGSSIFGTRREINQKHKKRRRIVVEQW